MPPRHTCLSRVPTKTPAEEREFWSVGLRPAPPLVGVRAGGGSARHDPDPVICRAVQAFVIGLVLKNVGDESAADFYYGPLLMLVAGDASLEADAVRALYAVQAGAPRGRHDIVVAAVRDDLPILPRAPLAGFQPDVRCGNRDEGVITQARLRVDV